MVLQAATQPDRDMGSGRVDPMLPILVVDDYGTMVRILKSQLRQIGYVNVDDAKDGLEALAKLKAKPYELIISDWHMTPMSGYELLQTLRDEIASGALRFMMVTAESKSDNVLAARKAGAHNYLIKPFTAQMLKVKIEETMTF